MLSKEKREKYFLYFVCILLIPSIIGMGYLSDAIFNSITGQTKKEILNAVTTINGKSYYPIENIDVALNCYNLEESQLKLAKTFIILFWIIILPYLIYLITKYYKTI